MFYFLDKEGNASGIDDATVTEAGLTVRQLSRGQLQVSGLDAGGVVKIYDLSGRMLSSIKADGSGQATVDLSQQPKGVYIVNINNRRTIKIQVR